MKHHNHDTNLNIGSSFSKQEHTVVNIGDPDGDTLRLVSHDFRAAYVGYGPSLLTQADYMRPIIPGF